jgi:hypothetical protein
MGRKKLNRTPEQLRALNRARVQKHYQANKTTICKKRMEKYYENLP